jgi:hypothetical protein
LITNLHDLSIMAILNFTLSPEALGKLHDALVCLGKFSEAVSLEASHDKVSGSETSHFFQISSTETSSSLF